MVVYQVEVLDIRDEKNEVIGHSALFSNRMTAEAAATHFKELYQTDIKKEEVYVALRQHYIIED